MDLIRSLSRAIGISPRWLLGIVLALLLGVLVYTSTFVVQEGRQGIVLEFGRYIKAEPDAGLHFKWPWRNVESISHPDRVLRWDSGQQETFNTSKGEVVQLNVFVRWRIADPEKFWIRIGPGLETQAQSRIETYVKAALRGEINDRSYIEVVRSDNSLVDRLNNLLESLEEIDEDEIFGITGVNVDMSDEPEEGDGAVDGEPSADAADDQPAADAADAESAADPSVEVPEEAANQGQEAAAPTAQVISLLGEISPEYVEGLRIDESNSRISLHNVIQSKVSEQIDDDLEGAIEIIDFRIRSISIGPKIEQGVFNSLAQRQLKIAFERIARGEAQRDRLLGEAVNEYYKIFGPGQEEALEIKGAADAEIARLYSEAYGSNAGFGDFVNLLMELEKRKLILNADASRTRNVIMTPSQTGVFENAD